MPLATSATTEALANTLASLRGLTPDEAVATALRAELDRETKTTVHRNPGGQIEPSVAEILDRVRRLGPWDGPDSAQLTDELYDAAGLPR